MGEALLAVLPGKGRIGSRGDPLARLPVFLYPIPLWTPSLWMRRSRLIGRKRETCVPSRHSRSRLQARFLGKLSGSRAFETRGFLSRQLQMVVAKAECLLDREELRRENSRFFRRWLEPVRREPGSQPGLEDQPRTE